MANALLPPNIVKLANCNPIDASLRVDLHFHPDMPYRDTTVIENIAHSKRYHSQFVTGISNGRAIEGPRGDRILWEEMLFDGLYDRGNTYLERPKYGALNFSQDMYGSAARFGSCCFRLKQHYLARTTFCFPDSALSPEAFGTAEHFDLLKVVKSAKMDDPLDWYIEAHVHGPIRIPEDIEALVLDPSYRGTYVDTAASRLGCSVECHQGYETTVVAIHQNGEYRGDWVASVMRTSLQTVMAG